MSIATIRRVTAICLAFVGLLLCGNAFCQQPKESDYVVISYTIQMDWIFPVGSKATTLSRAEIDGAEQLVRECIEKYNVEQRKLFQEAKKTDPDVRESDYVIDVNRYKRQYVCATNTNGEKVVWVNFLCGSADEPDWRKTIVDVKDGGNCFFQVKINLTKRTYFDFSVNGDA